MEDGPLELQFLPQRVGVGEVSVVGQSHGSLDVVDHNGLGIAAVGLAGGAVAYMAQGGKPLPQRGQGSGGKDVSCKPQPLVGGENPVVVDHDAAALLPPVLEGQQPAHHQVRCR